MTSMISDTSDRNRPALILGGSGRLGAMLAAFWPVAAPLHLHSTRAQTDFMVFDLILDPKKTAVCMGGMGAIFCLAGVTPARAKATEEVFSRNSELALAAIRAAHAAGAGRVFVASSAAVYGASGGLQVETDNVAPVSEYGQAKLEMEIAALAEGRRLGHPVTVLRIGNVAGADAILGGWRAQMQIDQLADGSTPKRSYIGPRSLAFVLHQLSLCDALPDVLNIAAAGAVEMGALLDAAGLDWSPRPAPENVIADVTLSHDLLAKYARLPTGAGTPQTLVGEWRDFQNMESSK